MVKKKSYLVLIVLVTLSLIIGAFHNCCMALDAINDPNYFKPTQNGVGDLNVITTKTNSIIGIIVTVGTIISVITMLILGIKYMLASVEEKAEYKKSMMPYLVGAVLLFSGSVIVRLIANIVQESSLAG